MTLCVIDGVPGFVCRDCYEAAAPETRHLVRFESEEAAFRALDAENV